VSAAYSHRFIIASQASASYVVPAGKRAVAKCLSGRNTTAGSDSLQLWIGNSPVLVLSVPAGSGAQLSQVMCVAYAGETLTLVCGSGLFGQVSGYLLDA
jgi:hypothetical protein